MLLFKPEHVEKILSGEKTISRWYYEPTKSANAVRRILLQQGAAI